MTATSLRRPGAVTGSLGEGVWVIAYCFRGREGESTLGTKDNRHSLHATTLQLMASRHRSLSYRMGLRIFLQVLNYNLIFVGYWMACVADCHERTL